ncbi:MAG: hypothetical protein WB609_06715 [Candidatus Cybelea sp.]
MAANTDAHDSLASILASARDLAFVFAIFAFFAGAEYRYWFYRDLGIPVSSFSIVNSQIIADSYSVFAPHARDIALFFVILAALIFVSHYIAAKRKLSTYRNLVILFLLVAALPLLEYWSNQSAAVAFSNAVNIEGGVPDRAVIIAPAKGQTLDTGLGVT